MSRIRIAVDFDSEEYAIDWMAEAEASGLLRGDVPAVALADVNVAEPGQRRNWVLRVAGARFGGVLEADAR